MEWTPRARGTVSSRIIINSLCVQYWRYREKIVRIDIFGSKPPHTQIRREITSETQIAMGFGENYVRFEQGAYFCQNPHSNLRFRGTFPSNLCVCGGFDPKMSLLICSSVSLFSKRDGGTGKNVDPRAKKLPKKFPTRHDGGDSRPGS